MWTLAVNDLKCPQQNWGPERKLGGLGPPGPSLEPRLIQSPTAEIRRAKKKKKKKERNRMKIYMVSLFHRATINKKIFITKISIGSGRV